jgi:GMP synthase-like glutamine amidotransferase
VRVLIFRHVPFEGAGRIEAVLARRGVSFEYLDLYRPDQRARGVEEAAGLIFLGGPMSANDDLPYLRVEVDVGDTIRVGGAERTRVELVRG